MSTLISVGQNIDSITTHSNQNFGIFENQTNIGSPTKKGEVAYDKEKQEFTVTGSGINMWYGSDQFQYLYKSLQGDFILRARVQFVGEGVDPHRKMGWIIRNNLNGNSPHINATVHGDGLTSLQYRKEIGGDTQEVGSTDLSPDVIQLERRGGTYFMSTAKFGEAFTTVQVDDVKLNNEVFVGLYVCSHNPDVVEKAIFSNVRITRIRHRVITIWICTITRKEIFTHWITRSNM